MPLLVSVIIPVYNVEDYLDRCLKSVIDQTHQNLEIIIVNDGSNDKSPVICDTYASLDDRVKAFHISNGGSSIARNYGLKHCTGDFIAFVDSDDWIAPEMIQTLLDFALENNLSVVECSALESDVLSNLEDHPNAAKSGIIESQEEALERVIRLKRFAVWRRIYHRSVVKERRFIEHILHQDVYFTIDLLKEISHIGFIDFPLYHYNVENEQSVIRSGYSIKKLKAINAGEYVVKSTTGYTKIVQDYAKQYLFEFLTYHYNALFKHEDLDADFKHRKHIKKTLAKYHSFDNFNFYCFAIIVLPKFLYRLFLKVNQQRIKSQLRINQKLKNV